MEENDLCDGDNSSHNVADDDGWDDRVLSQRKTYLGVSGCKLCLCCRPSGFSRGQDLLSKSYLTGTRIAGGGRLGGLPWMRSFSRGRDRVAVHGVPVLVRLQASNDVGAITAWSAKGRWRLP